MKKEHVALIGVLAVIVFLVGATVVFAQSSTVPFGRGMMQAPGTNSTTTPNGSGPASGNYGPGMMGNGTTGPGGMMSGDNWNKMRDAMNSGNWDQMRQTCQDALNSYQQGQGTQGTSATPTASRTSTRGAI